MKVMTYAEIAGNFILLNRQVRQVRQVRKDLGDFKRVFAFKSYRTAPVKQRKIGDGGN